MEPFSLEWWLNLMRVYDERGSCCLKSYEITDNNKTLEIGMENKKKASWIENRIIKEFGQKPE